MQISIGAILEWSPFEPANFGARPVHCRKRLPMPAWSYPVCIHASVRASTQHRRASDDIGLHGSRRRRARQSHGRVRLAETGVGIRGKSLPSTGCDLRRIAGIGSCVRKAGGLAQGEAGPGPLAGQASSPGTGRQGPSPLTVPLAVAPGVTHCARKCLREVPLPGWADAAPVTILVARAGIWDSATAVHSGSGWHSSSTESYTRPEGAMTGAGTCS
jgi:hypothetical protein